VHSNSIEEFEWWVLTTLPTGPEVFAGRGCIGNFSKKKIFSNTFFSQCKLVDMVCRMKSHQGRFQKKSFSCVLCAFSCVFFLFCWGKCVFGWFSYCFHCCSATCVAFRPPPFLQAHQGTHHVYIFLYSLLYQMKEILSPCTICLPRVLRHQIPFRLFQHMFCYLWITMLQTSLDPLYLNNSLGICLYHQLHHLPLAPYISWLTLIVYILS